MISILVSTLLAILIAIACITLSTWRQNYKSAQTVGFPTFYSPYGLHTSDNVEDTDHKSVHITDVWWLILYPTISALIQRTPDSWHIHWLPLSQIWSIWKHGHEPFRLARNDSLMLSTPRGNMLWTCDHAVIKQLFSLRTVHITIAMLKFYDIWGPTIGSVEGDEWKRHRKVITYGLNPSTLPTVWKESIQQAKRLTEIWSENQSVVPVAKIWTSQLALHTIAAVFFDEQLRWKMDQNEALSDDKHQVTFQNALFTVLSRLGLIFMIPRSLLRLLPFKATQEAYVALTEWTKFMLDMRSKTMNRIEDIVRKPKRTILESIVIAGHPEASGTSDGCLSEESVLGNIFFALMAGHETTGNTLAFCLLLLAVYPDQQELIQVELDERFGSRLMEDWSVDQDFHVLQKGTLGRFIKEVLRLYNVIPFMVRTTVAPTRLIDSSGISHTVPPNTTCIIDVAAAFHNPSVWIPSDVARDRRAQLHHSPAIDFDPSRWSQCEDDDESFGPFGVGPRKCPGMPFAQVEMVAVLATIMKGFSLRLMIDETTLAQCGGDQRAAWELTRDEAIVKLKDNIEQNVNIQMVKELPICLIRRAVEQ